MAEPTLLKPDQAFIDRVVESGGESLKHCYQCATCSVVCELSPDRRPFPRKEMIWSQWGLKDRLIADPDVWLCYQCNDCSTHCPRGARPGDVMGAIRREGVIHYASPGFFARWVNRPTTAPVVLVVAAVLLGLALLLRDPLAEALGITRSVGDRIVYAYTPVFPHWLLNGFFIFFGLLALLVVVLGVLRFWRDMKGSDAREGKVKPKKPVGASLVSALKKIITHGDFPTCSSERPRFLSHLLVFYGFIALSLVAFWIVTIRLNPLVPSGFAFPFAFWSPWKILANLAGAAVLAGCVLMILERLRAGKKAGAGSFFDWALLILIPAVVGSGFFTEVLHYFRVVNLRYVAYFTHLVFVFSLLMYLPYSKLAHMVYRTAALVYAEHSGRIVGPPAEAAAREPVAAPVQAADKAEADPKEGAGTGGEQPTGTEDK
ncbi:MAG: quinone-interacting membrane-bound oxidoreductase complex subunit QmoC [Planctomycetota bacterium]|jgi:quinone-modifying oxidoreductase subunit QmoC